MDIEQCKGIGYVISCGNNNDKCDMQICKYFKKAFECLTEQVVELRNVEKLP